VTNPGERKVETVKIKGFVQPTKSNPNPAFLSRARAQAVEKYLKSYGLSANYVITAAGNAKSNTPASRVAEIVVTWS
jgi:outer membrane protein OmpA-like peptidoglycan-associated protein